MKLTTAAEASRLPEEDQNNIAEAVAAGEDVKSEEIKQLAKEKKEEEHCKATMDQMQETVSDTDTTEEEKENARRLHVCLLYTSSHRLQENSAITAENSIQQ